jgi:hypothetical protein
LGRRPRRARRAAEPLELPHHLAGAIREHRPRNGGAKLRTARQEGNADVGLELLQPAPQRGARDAQHACGPLDRSGFDHGEKGGNGIERGGHLLFTKWN